jgi:hypothetical protein
MLPTYDSSLPFGTCRGLKLAYVLLAVACVQQQGQHKPLHQAANAPSHAALHQTHMNLLPF